MIVNKIGANPYQNQAQPTFKGKIIFNSSLIMPDAVKLAVNQGLATQKPFCNPAPIESAIVQAIPKNQLGALQQALLDSGEQIAKIRGNLSAVFSLHKEGKNLFTYFELSPPSNISGTIFTVLNPPIKEPKEIYAKISNGVAGILISDEAAKIQSETNQRVCTAFKTPLEEGNPLAFLKRYGIKD